MKFFVCDLCGNLVVMVKESGKPMSCCNQTMKELIPGTTDGATEKHLPVCEVDGNKVCVKVGSVEHPMTDAHYIEWIAIETSKGSQMKKLCPNDAPKAEFVLAEGETLVSAYSYCNLHGLWKS